MDVLWTLPELVAEVAARIAALPAPKNGQVRAVPDERTVRYYVTLGLLDRPSAMRGRTALYGARHVAQVVAIKRLQTMGRSLSEIQQMWPTLDDATLGRMSGVALPAAAKPPARTEFWKRAPAAGSSSAAGSAEDPAGPSATGGPRAPHARHVGSDPGEIAGETTAPDPARAPSEPYPAPSPRRVPAIPANAAPPTGPGAVELRIELAPRVVLSLSVADDRMSVSPADVRAIRAAAAPLLTELASRRFAHHPGGEHP